MSETDRFWELALAVNAAFKGLLGSMGQSGHICAKTRFIEANLNIAAGWEALYHELARLLIGHLEHGDVVVIPDKIVAAAQGRIVPRRVVRDPDPKTVDAATLASLAARYSTEFGFPVTPLHLLLADEYPCEQATLGALDHNLATWQLAREIHDHCARQVDVVISDTDTGLDVRAPLIGCVTIAATPLGATAGVTLYEAMRCAVAAEFVRGHDRMIPVVICNPAERRRARDHTGERRTYDGALHIDKESGVTYV